MVTPGRRDAIREKNAAHEKKLVRASQLHAWKNPVNNAFFKHVHGKPSQLIQVKDAGRIIIRTAGDYVAEALDTDEGCVQCVLELVRARDALRAAGYDVSDFRTDFPPFWTDDMAQLFLVSGVMKS